jgi:hypothetical protein
MEDIGKVIDVFNDLLEADPDVFVKLFNQRVECNEVFAKMPYVQVGAFKKGTNRFIKDEDSEVEYKVGVLGLLNAVIEPLTGDIIAVDCDLEEDKTTFIKIKKFGKWGISPEEW